MALQFEGPFLLLAIFFKKIEKGVTFRLLLLPTLCRAAAMDYLLASLC
jgi:hypothetical protein